MRKSQRNRKQGVVVTIVASTDWQIVSLPQLAGSGVLAHISYRLASGGTNGSIDAKVIDGAYTAGAASAVIAAIPDDDVVYSEAGKALVNHATTAQQTNIISSVGESAIYDREGGYATTRAQYSEEERGVFLAVRGDGTLVGEVTVVIRAKDVSL